MSKPEPTKPHSDRAKELVDLIERRVPTLSLYADERVAIEKLLSDELGKVFDEGALKARSQVENQILRAFTGKPPQEHGGDGDCG